MWDVYILNLFIQNKFAWFNKIFVSKTLNKSNLNNLNVCKISKYFYKYLYFINPKILLRIVKNYKNNDWND